MGFWGSMFKNKVAVFLVIAFIVFLHVRDFWSIGQHRGRRMSRDFMLRCAALRLRRGSDARGGPPLRLRQPLMQPV